MPNAWREPKRGQICWLSVGLALIGVDQFKGERRLKMSLEFDSNWNYNFIDNLEINAFSRDDIDRILLTSTFLYVTRAALTINIALIGCAYRRITATDSGRPGMEYWSILVLNVLKHALNDDFNRLIYHANWDAKLRELMEMEPVADVGKEFNL